MKNFSFLILLAAMTLPSLGERQPYERYQTIVDRQMFGAPPEGFDPSKRPSEVKGGRDAKKDAQELTKEQAKIKSAIRFSMINVTPDGETAVGFTDSSNAKNPKNYYLKIGETRGGWTVKEADSIQGTMTIVKGDIEVELSLGGDSAKGAGKTSSTAAGAADAAPGGSLRARRLQREAQRNAKMDDLMKRLEERDAADAKRREEEARQREQEKEEKAARDAERQEQQAKLKDLAEQLRRAREDRERQMKAEESEKPDDSKDGE